MMRAARCKRAGLVELEETAVPAVGPGEVLLAVRRCGVCGSDLHYYRGEQAPPSVCPGHEIAAEVAQVGKGGAPLREGDRVVVEAVQGCGVCAECRVGRAQRCRRAESLGFSLPGGFADYVRAAARHVYVVPDRVGDELAQLTEPVAVSVHGLRLAQLEAGQRVLVLGAGTIGLTTTFAAVRAGAEVVVSAKREHQATAARALGAHAVFRTDEAEALKAATKRDAVDVVVETVGSEEALAHALRAVRPGGAVVLLGIYRSSPKLDAQRLTLKEVRVIGAVGYDRHRGRADFERALDLLELDGSRLRAACLTHEYPLSEIDAAYRCAADKVSGAVKVSVVVGGARG